MDIKRLASENDNRNRNIRFLFDVLKSSTDLFWLVSSILESSALKLYSDWLSSG